MTPTTPSPISDQAAGELLPCPFCSCKLLPNTNRGDLYVKRYGPHWDHPGGLCFLADAEVSPSEVDAWNARSTAPTIGSAPVAVHFKAKYADGSVDFCTEADGFDPDVAEMRGGVEIIGLAEISAFSNCSESI